MAEKCILCGGHVEKQDKVCSKCGHPIDRTEGLRNFVGNIVIFVFLIAMLAGIIWLFKYLT